MTLHVFFMFPETAGKSLEEVESMFLDPKAVRYLGTAPWRTAVVKNALRDDLNFEKGVSSAHKESVEGDAHVQDEEAGSASTAVHSEKTASAVRA